MLSNSRSLSENQAKEKYPLFPNFFLNHDNKNSKIDYEIKTSKTEDFVMKNILKNSAFARIHSLLDENSFVEIGAEITARSTDFHLYKEELPKDGVITGYGQINGRLVYVYSQDSSVLGGAIGEMHSRKITRLYDMALKMGAPIIGILDSSGVRLQESMDALAGLGEIYQKQAIASGIIPQYALIMGNCGGGLSMIPALCDFTFIEETNGSLFLQSPNAIPSNHRDICDTTRATWKSTNSQSIDFIGKEEDLYLEVRRFIDMLPSNNRYDIFQEEFCEDDPNRDFESLEAKDPSILLTELADYHVFVETKKETTKEMVTGFLQLNGMTIGCIANRTTSEGSTASLTALGAKKAGDFLTFCDAFHIPILTLTNVSGFQPSFESEVLTAANCASFVSSYSFATVPKVTLILEEAFGSASLIMGSKSLGTDLVYAWKDARIGSMDGEKMANILYKGESKKIIKEKAAEYEQTHASARAAAAHGHLDRIIDPIDTRKYLISAFDMLASKRDVRMDKKHFSR